MAAVELRRAYRWWLSVVGSGRRTSTCSCCGGLLDDAREAAVVAPVRRLLRGRCSSSCSCSCSYSYSSSLLLLLLLLLSAAAVVRSGDGTVDVAVALSIAAACSRGDRRRDTITVAAAMVVDGCLRAGEGEGRGWLEEIEGGKGP